MATLAGALRKPVQVGIQVRPVPSVARRRSRTGFGDFIMARGEHPVGVDAVVSKPITIDGLRDAIADVTAVRLPVA